MASGIKTTKNPERIKTGKTSQIWFEQMVFQWFLSKEALHTPRSRLSTPSHLQNDGILPVKSSVFPVKRWYFGLFSLYCIKGNGF